MSEENPGEKDNLIVLRPTPEATAELVVEPDSRQIVMKVTRAIRREVFNTLVDLRHLSAEALHVEGIVLYKKGLNRMAAQYFKIAADKGLEWSSFFEKLCEAKAESAEDYPEDVKLKILESIYEFIVHIDIHNLDDLAHYSRIFISELDIFFSEGILDRNDFRELVKHLRSTQLLDISKAESIKNKIHHCYEELCKKLQISPLPLP